MKDKLIIKKLLAELLQYTDFPTTYACRCGLCAIVKVAKKALRRKK